MSDDLGARLKEASLLEGDFVLRSGKKSHVYLDKYLFETQPALLADIAAALAGKLALYEPVDILAGPELGAVPLVTAVSLRTGTPFVIVRKAGKEYGTQKVFEGRAEPGQSVVVVEDVVTTGGAALSAVERLRERGLDVRALLCVVDREQGGGEAFSAANVPFVPLFTASGLGIRTG
jgi:orotate phosphoribosyltransferase